MRLLLDTQIILWFLSADRRLKPSTLSQIQKAKAVFFSAASLWEIAIKSATGRLRVHLPTLLPQLIASGFRELPVVGTHALRVATLPDHHKDPFDRLLVAQAICEPLQ